MPLNRPIYLDYLATTPVDERVLAAMLPYFSQQAGNPGSAHLYGWEATAAIDRARELIATALNASPEDIIFTSGATEANNLAIKGVAEAYLSKGRHLVTVATEHSAVLEPCRYLESLGFEVTYLPVQPDGLIALPELAAALRPETILVSVMAANNEIGVLQPLAEIGTLCRQHGVLFHSDAAQAAGKIPLDVAAMQIDLLSLTAHKIYGPKGIGALYVRQQARSAASVQLAAQLHGGGQQRGLRSGTLPTPLIVGLGEALGLALAEQAAEAQRLHHLRQQLWAQLQHLEGVIRNGHPECCLPGCLNLSIPGIDGTALHLGVQPQVALSSGATCSAANAKPSHVLTALGRSPALARASLRFGLGRWTTNAEIDRVARLVIATVQAFNPPYRHLG